MRTEFAALLRAATAIALACAGGALPLRADDSLAAHVPGDVGLFIELRAADDLLTPLVEPRIWLTLAELAGQPGGLTDTGEWRARVEQTVRMSPVEAIHTLFSHRVAFVADSLRSTHDAVILCRPIRDTRELVEHWQARPLPSAGPSAVYRLPFNVGLALRKDTLAFGDPTIRGLFDRVLQQWDDPRSAALAADVTFRSLLHRAPPDPDGVLFVRLAKPADGPSTAPAPAPTLSPAMSAPASAPTTWPAHVGAEAAPSTPRAEGVILPNLPSGLRHSRHVLLALHREGPSLHVSALGDGTDGRTSARSPVDDLVTSLPAATLLTWVGHVDYPQLVRAAALLPENSVFRVLLQLQEGSAIVQRLIDTLGSETCIALGTVSPASRQVPAPPVPAVAFLVKLRDPNLAASEWSSLVRNTAALYKLLSLKLATPPRLPPVETVLAAGIQIEKLDLSGLISPTPEQTPVGELHLSWVVDGDTLVLASHTDWLAQVLAARHGSTSRLAGILEQSRRPAGEPHETVFVLQLGALSDIAAAWVQFLSVAYPDVTTENWWRNYQPGGSQVRLGIQAIADPSRPSVRVQSVTPGSPADGMLRAGDEIVGCQAVRLTTSQPADEIRQAILQRPNARWVDLLVERDGVTRVRRIAVPFVDPVEILRRIIALGQLVQTVIYVDMLPEPEGPRGQLTLRVRAEPPASAPAISSQPATLPTTSTAPAK